MKKLICILILTLGFNSFAQDELAEEIDKLETGNTEESAITNQSVEDLNDIIDNSEEAFQEAAPAPDTLPDDFAPQAPMETWEDVPATQPAFEEVPPPSMEESFDDIQEQYVEPAPESLPPSSTEDHSNVVVQKRVHEEIVPVDFENRLSRIYQQFYTEATTDEAWSQIVGDRVNETYTVQPGDTLWDISVTFFGNGHYWPKMWQVNDEITNPHSISAGYMLRFVPGRIEDAPSLRIVKDDNGSVNTVAVNLEDPNTSRPEAIPVIPPPSKKYVPVLTNLPPSLPIIKGRVASGYDKNGFSIQTKKVNVAKSLVYVPSYISEEAPDQIGKIIENEGENRSEVGIYEHTYVRMEEDVQVGTRVLVYDIGENVLNVNGSDYVGKPVYLQGELEIQELINSEKNIYRALVVKAIHPIKIGSFISKQKLLVTDISEAGPSSDVQANVVGGQLDSKRAHMGLHEVVYLDKGASDGLKTGQVLSIIRNSKKRGKKSLIQDLSQQIAKVKIVQTTDKVATALVLKSKEDIRKGDFVGSLRKQAKSGFDSSNLIEDPESEQEYQGDEFIDEE